MSPFRIARLGGHTPRALSTRAVTLHRGTEKATPCRSLQVRQDLTGGAFACLHGAVEVPLEIDRRVLAGEMAVAGALAFGTRERGVLTDLPVAVGALRPRVPGPEVDRRAAVELRGDPREQRLDLLEELLRARRGRTGSEAGPDIAAGVVDEDPGAPGLRPRDLPRVLVAGVRVRVAVVAQADPVAIAELDVELGVGAHPLLADRARLHG